MRTPTRIPARFCLPCLLLLPGLPGQSGWSTPVIDNALTSTSASDLGPHISADGLTMHLARYNNSSLNWDIYVASRTGRGQAWSAPAVEATLSDATGHDSAPFLRADGLEIYFATSSRSGQGSLDIMRATRTSTAAPWGTPTYVSEVNDASAADGDPSITADGLTLFFLSNRTGSPNAPNGAVWMAQRTTPTGKFGTPTLVTEVSSTSAERDPEISPDGLRLVFIRQNRTTSALDVMFAERTNPTAKFSAPVALPGLAGLGVTLSRDGSELYLCQNNGAPAYYDVYVTRFAGLTTDGIASTTGVMRVHYRDPGAGGKVFLGALSLGSTPGFPLDTRTVPLNVDGLLLMSIGGLSGVTTGYGGALPPSGETLATIANPHPALAGLRIWTAFFTLDGAAPSGVLTISNVRPIELAQ